MPDQVDFRPVQQPGYYYPPQPQQGADGMAVASLVLSLLWGAGILSVVAVIFGHVSLGPARDRIRGLKPGLRAGD